MLTGVLEILLPSGGESNNMNCFKYQFLRDIPGSLKKDYDPSY
jgi:hypothetical protein